MKRHTRACQSWLTIAGLSTSILTSTHLSLLQAQTPTKPSAANPEIEAIKPLVRNNTIVVAQIDLKRLDLPENVRKNLATNENLKQQLEWLSSLQKSFDPLLNDRLTLMIDVPMSASQAPLRLMAQKPGSLNLDNLNEALSVYRFAPAAIEGDFVTLAPFGLVESNASRAVSREILVSNDSLLAKAAASIETLPLQILIVPPPYMVRTYEDLMPQLPQSWGGTPMATLTEGLQWAAIGIDPAKLQIEATIQSKSAAAAERLARELPKLIKVAATAVRAEAGNQTSATYLRGLESLSGLAFTVNGDRVKLAPVQLTDAVSSSSLVAELLTAIIDPVNQREKMNRFKQMALAVHNYESANKVLPPNKAARNVNGKSGLSWRVHILPYIDQLDLYKQFKLNEDWNSPHNIKLLEKMPDVFGSASPQLFEDKIRPGYTTFVAPVGEGTIFGGKEPVTFAKIQDGTSNTIFFVEVKSQNAVPWTAPIDYSFDPARPARDLAVGNDKKPLVAFADGSVRLLPASISDEDLLHLFQMNDGSVVNIP